MSPPFNRSEFSLFSPFTNLSRSKLNPSRKDRRKAAISLSEAIDREVAVVLSLQHAINVPLRERTEVPHEEEDEDEDDLGANDFIQISVQINVHFYYYLQIDSFPVQRTWRWSVETRTFQAQLLKARQRLGMKTFALASSKEQLDIFGIPILSNLLFFLQNRSSSVPNSKSL